MKNSILKVASISPNIRISNCSSNTDEIIASINRLYDDNCDIICFPRMAITGYSMGDMIRKRDVIESINEALNRIKLVTENKKILVAIGVCIKVKGLFFDATAILGNGKIYGIVPNNNLNANAEYDETKIFDKYYGEIIKINLCDEEVSFGNLYFDIEGYRVGVFNGSITKDNYMDLVKLSNKVDIVIHLGSEIIIPNKVQELKELISTLTGINKNAYIYTNVGKGESTTDNLYTNVNIIAQNNELKCLDGLFAEENENIANVNLMLVDRTKSFSNDDINIPMEDREADNIDIDEKPYYSSMNKNEYINQVMAIQIAGAIRRLQAINTDKVIVGVSGGLDSTLTLLVASEVMKKLQKPSKNIIAVTMPCFGTSDRTFNNAYKLMEKLDVTIEEINIKDAVKNHLQDIGHNFSVDVTYENAQARERTQILFDLANMLGAIVLGTGDLSETALGFATFNGDHISNYNVNASIPKTIMRDIIQDYAKRNPDLSDVLYDIHSTPVSPELLPDKQITEDIVGPYELHDFFIYYFVKHSLSKEDIVFLAKKAFKDKYSQDVIEKWYNIFIKRFVNNQFKRSCCSDGVNATGLSLSPRGSFKMPSDMDNGDWVV